MFLANGVDQSRVEVDERLRLEDIPCKFPLLNRPEVLGSLVHALGIICAFSEHLFPQFSVRREASVRSI